MSVQLDLKNLKKLDKGLNFKVEPSLLYSGEILRGRILKQWLKGTAPDGSGLKKGNAKYLAYKGSKGRRKKIDFNLSGDMQQAFSVKKTGRNAIMLWFMSAKERAKALGNYNKRKNFLRVGKKLRTEITNIFYKRLKK